MLSLRTLNLYSLSTNHPPMMNFLPQHSDKRTQLILITKSIMSLILQISSIGTNLLTLNQFSSKHPLIVEKRSMAEGLKELRRQSYKRSLNTRNIREDSQRHFPRNPLKILLLNSLFTVQMRP